MDEYVNSDHVYQNYTCTYSFMHPNHTSPKHLCTLSYTAGPQQLHLALTGRRDEMRGQGQLTLTLKLTLTLTLTLAFTLALTHSHTHTLSALDEWLRCRWRCEVVARI